MSYDINDLKTDIEKILAYNWKDERNDYLDNHDLPDETKPELMVQHHIFTTLVRLSNFIDW